MKKLTFILLAVAGSLAFINCSGDDDKGSAIDCASHANRIGDAAVDYSNDPTTANCNAYRDALQDAIDDNCQASTYQTILDNLDCN